MNLVDLIEGFIKNHLMYFIRDFLRVFDPYFKWISLPILFLVFFFICFYLFYHRKLFFKYFFKYINFYSIILILLLIIITFFLKVPVVPAFRLITDEGRHVYNANLLSQKGVFVNFSDDTNDPRSFGYALLLLFPILLFNSMKSIFFFNLIISILSSVLIFIIIKILTKNDLIAFIFSFIFSINFGNFFTFAGSSPFQTFYFFMLLSILFFLCYVKTKKEPFLIMNFLLLCFVVYIRVESAVLFLPYVLWLFFYKIKLTKRTKFILIILFLLSIPYVSFQISDDYMHFEVLEDELSDFLGSEKLYGLDANEFSNFSFIGLKNLIFNTKHYSRFIFNNRFQPYFILFFLILSFFMFKSQKKFFILFLLMFIVLYVLHFTVWFQTLGGHISLYLKSKYYLVMQIPLIILSSYGLLFLFKQIKHIFFSKKFRKVNFGFKNKKSYLFFQIVIVIILLVFSLFWFYKTKELRFSHMYSKEKQNYEQFFFNDFVKDNFNEDCLVVTKYKVLVPLLRNKIVKLKDFYRNKERYLKENHECILILEDITLCDTEFNLDKSKECIIFQELAKTSNYYKQFIDLRVFVYKE